MFFAAAVHAGAAVHRVGSPCIMALFGIYLIGRFIVCNGETEITYRDINYATSKYDIDEIVLPDTIKKIHDDAFFDCSEIKRINIPVSVQYIGAQAFWGMDELEELTITNNIGFVGKHAFCNCRKLTLMISCKEPEIPSDWDADFYANIKNIIFVG